MTDDVIDLGVARRTVVVAAIQQRTPVRSRQDPIGLAPALFGDAAGS